MLSIHASHVGMLGMLQSITGGAAYVHITMRAVYCLGLVFMGSY